MRLRGSHIVMQKRLDTSTITVPVPNHSELRIGTLLSCLSMKTASGLLNFRTTSGDGEIL
jgi:predicted RNA binding protein YcfA (HicA-like mRNA interferase family)